MKLLRLGLGALCLALALQNSAFAGPGLLITPHRVVLGGRDREAKITVSNAGDETGGYRLFFTNYEMTPSGAFEPVTEAAAGKHSDAFVRFSPRHLVLAPGETQVVRLAVRRPADLASGEYRSHLVFQSVPRKGEVQPLVSAKGKSRAAVTTLYGISIPVIYRHRTSRPGVAVAAAEVERAADGTARLTVALTRTGDESTYGNLKVSYRNPRGEKFTPVGESNGNAIYLPLDRRTVSVPLTVGAFEKGGVLRILYENDDGVLASKDVTVE